jgi:WD40 repeat protein
LWDYASSTLLSEAAGHSGGITSISLSPDDKQVVSVGEDGSIFYWYLLTNIEGAAATGAVEQKEGP